LHSISGLSSPEIKQLLTKEKIPTYRSKQLIDWIYKKHIFQWQDMSNIPKEDQKKLSEIFSVFSIKPVDKLISSKDQTVKVLFQTNDNKCFETVLLNDNNRKTLCVSSQIGCNMGCRFCATGQIGLTRNLYVAEIVEQYLYFSLENNIANIVFMGMGEPLQNYDNVLKAISILDFNANFSARRITISTCGLVPQMKKLAREKLPIKLAISLNACTDKQRQQLMPIGKIHRIGSLISAIKYFTQETGNRVTIEYVLLRDINDDEQSAKNLIKITKNINCNFNLIQYNPVDKLGFKDSTNSRIQQFKYWLVRDRKTVSIRYKRGRDIKAACGQLAKINLKRR